MKQRFSFWLVATCFTLSSISFAADGKRSITEVDLYNFQWIADAQISPGGGEVIYTLVKTTPKHDDYQTSLWIVPSVGGPARQLTSGPHDSAARWSPDGKSVAFLRRGDRGVQIYLLPMSGGEARPLTDLPKGAGEPVWSPDGRRIAFSSTTIASDFEPKKDPAEESDVRIITSAKYRLNGAGYPDRQSHIWEVDVPAVAGSAQKARQITSGEFTEGDMTWSRDSSEIYFVSNRVKDSDFLPPDSDVYEVGASGGAITKVASIDGPIHGITVSPDGARIAFIGDINSDGGPARSYSQPDLFVTSAQPGSTPKNLTANYDFDIGGGVGGDQGPPRGGGRSSPYWSADGKSIIVTSAEQGRVNLKRVDAASGKVSALTDGNFDVFSYHPSADGSKIAVLISTPVSIGDLFIVEGNSGHSQQITHINRELFSQLNLTEPEMIWYKSFDGRRIQAWVQRPPDFQEGRKYPMILDIHGGPHSAYGYTFDHEFQWMAAKGYVVLYPNPRGSTTYGQEFGNIIQYRYPGDDFKDLMAGVDDLIARGWADPDRLAVTGGSGGGVLTNWTVGHTNRFKAAASQRSIADWAGWWYGADMIAPSWFRGAPWESEADFKARSPITYVTQVTTPLMLIEGESDFRTPPAYGGEQMFRALKYQHKIAVMVRFPGETHELSRSGKPVHRVERLRHIVAWFDKYTQGQEIHTYDAQ
ncbi:MAG TPA: S9 family peptidase [Bryobacteraceae bacterium]|nr:S9 family peptidase [Bryobacteraceae bacterium]